MIKKQQQQQQQNIRILIGLLIIVNSMICK